MINVCGIVVILIDLNSNQWRLFNHAKKCILSDNFKHILSRLLLLLSYRFLVIKQFWSKSMQNCYSMPFLWWPFQWFVSRNATSKDYNACGSSSESAQSAVSQVHVLNQLWLLSLEPWLTQITRITFHKYLLLNLLFLLQIYISLHTLVLNFMVSFQSLYKFSSYPSVWLERLHISRSVQNKA